MITDRLNYYLESRSIMSNSQSGFRKGRSTTDAILCLESKIRKAEVNREIVAAVFFDVEKAYDLMWKEGLLIEIKILGTTGPMYNWIKDFLLERSIQVRTAECYRVSGTVVLEMGF